MFSITRPCSRCNGSGTVIEDPCPTCAGEGRLREMKRYRVNIPAGVREGSRIKLAGKGEAGLRGGPAGDLFVITHVTESPVFKPKGEHYEVEVPITVTEALGGAEVEVPTLNGTKKLRVAPGTKHGTVQRLRGEGPPILSGSGRGDLHYRFVIEMPTTLTQEQKDAVEQLSKVMNGNPRERILRAAGRALVMAARRTNHAHHGPRRPRPRRVHDLGRGRAGRDAPADPAHVRDARADRAPALAEGHPPLLPGRRRAPAPDPGDDDRVGHEPRRRRARLRARGAAPPHAAQGLDPRAARRPAPGGDRAPRGEARVGQGRARPLRGRSGHRAHPDPSRSKRR